MNALQITNQLMTAETMFNSEAHSDAAFELYENALEQVNDSNRLQVARLLKFKGSAIEVMSSCDSLIYEAPTNA